MSAIPPLQKGQSASTSGKAERGTGRSRARVLKADAVRVQSPTATRTAGDQKGDKPLFTSRVSGESTRRTQPRLRLTQSPPVTVRNAPRPTPLRGTTDPRWVLAVRTAELLQGDILSPECRERIVRMARLFDLTPFDANMIIAIVQDQARRGIAPHLCPAAGEPQLRMITPPQRKTLLQAIRERYGLKAVVLLGAMLAIEIALIAWVL